MKGRPIESAEPSIAYKVFGIGLISQSHSLRDVFDYLAWRSSTTNIDGPERISRHDFPSNVEVRLVVFARTFSHRL